MVAGHSVKTAALTGPPRPCVYCLRKCFGAQKPEKALKRCGARQVKAGLKRRSKGAMKLKVDDGEEHVRRRQ